MLSGERSYSLLQQAFDLHRAGRLREAAQLYRQVLLVEPNHADAIHHVGVVAHQLENLPEAIDWMRRSIELAPGSTTYRKNLASVYRSASRFEEAKQALLEVLAISPNDPIALQELGLTLDKLEQYEPAIDAYRRALALLHNSGDANIIARTYVNLGSSLMRVDRVDEALAAADEAVKFRNDYPLAHMNRADALFRLGRLAEAWTEYEWRWRRPNFTAQWLGYPQPLWDGSPLNSRTLLLWHEQGLGDTVQFCRYAPLAALRGGKVILLCPPPLRRLLQTLSPIVDIVTNEKPPPAFDVHLPLMSLPRVFGTTLSTIPATTKYLSADPEASTRWCRRLDAVAPQGLRIGLTWAGSPTHANDRNRSIPFDLLTPLLDMAGVSWISLQKGPAAERLRASARKQDMIDWTDGLTDFADTAALIDTLDLVITVDTAVCHVAAALGKPTWTLLPFNPDFRYTCDTDSSSWYSSMRLFRQPRAGNWVDAISQVAKAIRGYDRKH